MTDLYTCVNTLLKEVDRLANRSFFGDDFAAYPNNENLLQEEVRERLLEAGFDESDPEHENHSERESYLKLLGMSKGITYECVDNYGGEDCGREYYYIWKFTRGDESVAFKFEGWYASHYGSEYESYFQVKPVEKTVIVWE